MQERYIDRIRAGRPLWVLLAILLAALLIPALVNPGTAAAAPTTTVTVKKLASDGTSVLAEKTVDYHWMMNNLPVLGDGSTHYYHQGPVFVDDPDEAREQTLRWNQAEDTNVETKDMGALKGTNLKDLCDLVGGMGANDTLRVKARDGLSKTFAYKNIYRYSPREGPMGLCWYRDGQYPDSGFSEGLRLVWFADASTNSWGLHVFGNWDWHQAAEPRYWYYYQSGGEKYPTTTGLSVQYVSELIINSSQPATVGSTSGKAPAAAFSAATVAGPAPLTVQFTDQSANGPTTWSWDFDNDGTIDSNSASPTFTYEKEGVYTVRLTVQNSAGRDEELKSTYIQVGPGSSAPAPTGAEPQTTQNQTADPLADEGSTPAAGPASKPALSPALIGLAAVLAVGLAYALWARRRGQ